MKCDRARRCCRTGLHDDNLTEILTLVSIDPFNRMRHRDGLLGRATSGFGTPCVYVEATSLCPMAGIAADGAVDLVCRKRRQARCFAMSFDFDLTPKRLGRKERRDLFAAMTGRAGPYGEVTIAIGRATRRADLISATLPQAWVTDPALEREGPVRVGQRTRLVVGEEEADLTQNRRALNKQDRALHIKLGERCYSYLATRTGVEELRDSGQEPLLRIQQIRGAKRVTVLSKTDPVDLALGLILQGTDMRGLTVTRTVLLNVLDFLRQRRRLNSGGCRAALCLLARGELRLSSQPGEVGQRGETEEGLSSLPPSFTECPINPDHPPYYP